MSEKYTCIYAEKPSVGRQIASALGRTTGNGDGYIKIEFNGEPYIVTWGFGHLCELKQLRDYFEPNTRWEDIDLPFIPRNYDIVARTDVAKQIDIVRKIFNGAELIINATDPDREGEVIFSYLYENIGCKVPFKRAYYYSMTKEAFIESFNNLHEASETVNLTNAGRQRSIADWAVGMNITIANSLHCGTFMPVGRVQTPTLAMVVDRELKIRNFKPETYYVPTALFTTDEGLSYRGEYVTKEKVTDKREAQKVFNKLTGNAVVSKVEKKTKKVPTPPLYSLATLQMEASSKFGFSAQHTLDVAQSLYEKGYTTYPRSDSAYLPEDYKGKAKDALNTLSKIPDYKPLIEGKKLTFNKKYFDNSKVEAHFAIVPTNKLANSMSADESKLYDLIARSLICTCYSDATVENTIVTTEDNGVKFTSKGTVIKTKGWYEVIPASKETVLPVLAEGEVVEGQYDLAEKQTEPPKRYTDKTLIAAMMSADKDSDDKDIQSLSSLGVKGIGTEATRAGIIEGLVKRGFMERNKKSFSATDKGIALIRNLPIEDLKSATITAAWETRLNNIANGTENPEKFRHDIEEQVRDWCKTLSSAEKVIINSISSSAPVIKCPVCGKSVYKNKRGDWGCSGYKDGCKFYIGQIAGKKLTVNQIKTLCEKGETGKISGFTSKAGKKFDARLKLDETGKVQFNFD